MRHLNPMRRTLFLWLLLSSCQPKSQNQRHHGIPEEAVPGSFKVIVDSCIPAAKRLSFLQGKGQEIAGKVGCELDSVEALAFEQPAADLAATYHVQFKSCAMDQEKLKQTLAIFEETEGIKDVEAESVVKAGEESLELDDPLKEQQYYLRSIHRDEACRSIASTTTRPVIVAVIDTGVDQDHPDLVDSFLRDSKGKVVGANFVGKGSRGAADDAWDDQKGHGTHVAGLIAATAHNAKGVAGVGSCAPVRIMPVRVLGSNGKGTSLEIERGVEWALSHGADIINLSLGGTRFFKEPSQEHRSSLYEMANAKKVLVFAAAGNSSFHLGQYYEVEDETTKKVSKGYVYSFPGSYDNVITVAATNAKNQLTGFSNRGFGVDIAAPGSLTISTYLKGSYRNLSGTSMATPIAAGSYALVLSAVRNSASERFSYKDVKPLLTQSTGGPLFSKNDVVSRGVVDVLKLLNATRDKFAPKEPEPTPPEPAVEAPAPEAPPVLPEPKPEVCAVQ